MGLRLPVSERPADEEVSGKRPVARALGARAGRGHDVDGQGLRPAMVSNRQPLPLVSSSALARVRRDSLDPLWPREHLRRPFAGKEGDI